MSILRNKLKANFSQIPNALIADNSISRDARLVAIYLFTKPDLWEVNNSDVKKSLGISDNQTIANYWKELVVSGWIRRTPIRETGKFNGGYDYEIGRNVDIPEIGSTELGNFPNTEPTELGENPILNNTDSLINTKASKGKAKIKAGGKGDFCEEWEDDMLPYEWQDHAERFGLKDDRLFQSWRKFKDMTDWPMKFSRWKAWAEREKI